MARRLALALVLLLALALRVVGFEWDGGSHLHPDERFIIQVTFDRIGLPWQPDAHLLDPVHSRWNVRAACDKTRPNDFCGFAYGSLPVYLLKLTAEGVRPVAAWYDASVRGHLTPPPTSYDGLLRVGRVLSAVFDTLTVLATYLLGRELFNRRAGLFGALLVAVFPLQVQLAHFFATDSVATCFVTFALVQAIRVSRRRTGWLDLCLLGVLGAAAVASKAAAAPIVVPLALAAWLGARTHGRTFFAPGVARALVIVGIAGAAAYAMFEPYVVLSPAAMLRDVQQQGDMVRGVFVPPYTEQYLNTPAVLFQITNFFRFAAGPALLCLLLVGMGWAVLQSLRRQTAYWVLLGWLAPFLGITLSFQVKFLRYLEPALPAMTVLAAAMLARALEVRRPAILRHAARYTAAVAMLAAVVTSGAITVGLVHTWTTEHTRITASRWMLQNIPNAATVGGEHWDDTLPLALPDEPARQFQNIQFANYDRDTPEKRQQLIANIQRSDWIVLSSARLSAVIPRLPDLYPVTSAYYRVLEDGSLGFTPAAAFRSRPSILGWELNDDAADESWTVYDHPQVLIYHKTRQLTAEELSALLPEAPPPAALDAAWARVIHAAPRVQLFGDAALARISAAGTFTSVFPLEFLPGVLEVLLFYAVAQAAGLVLWPLLMRTFAAFPDRGYALAKPLGVLVLGYVPWALAGTGLVPYAPWVTRLWFLVLVGGGGALIWLRRGSVVPPVRRHWRRLLTVEAVFLAAFALLLAIRLANPDLWHPARGGEKPMDLAYLTAVSKSETLPPYDPWLAGAPMNYYYFGQALVGTLLRITGIPPATGFNLAVPLWFALSTVTVLTLGWMLARRLLGGLVAVALTLFASNLTVVSPLARVLAGAPEGKSILPPGTTPDLVQQMSWLQQAYYAVRVLPMIAAGTATPPTDFYWSPSRVTPGGIDEFPYFTFLFADLHAHLLALPLALLVLGCCAAYVVHPPRRLREAIVLFAAWGLALGSLGPANSWDLPSLATLSLAAILLRHALQSRRSWRRTGVAAIALAALASVLYRPFTAAFVNLQTLNARTPVDGIVDALAGKIPPLRAFFDPYSPIKLNANANEHSNLGNYLLLFGVFWVGLAAYGYLTARSDTLPLGRRREGLLWLIVAAGTTAAILPEFLVISDHMNTVFKFHFQAWYLLAIPASVALVGLPKLAREFTWGRQHRRLAWAPLAAVLVVGLIYPLTATGPRLRDRFQGADTLGPTLDGMAYMRVAVHNEKDQALPLAGDLAAIHWMQQNVPGTPRLLEADMDPYRWGSRVSTYTGLPTLFGWAFHQEQQLGNEIVSQRRAQVAALWAEADSARLLQRLRDLHVDLVYLGLLEKIVYGDQVRQRFQGLDGRGLARLYDAEGVVIYRVAEAPTTG